MTKRPGGLTAMAVLNFVFGGLGAIAALLGFGAIALIKEAIDHAHEQGVAYSGQSLTMAYVGVGAVAVSAFCVKVAGAVGVGASGLLPVEVPGGFCVGACGGGVVGVVEAL